MLSRRSLGCLATLSLVLIGAAIPVVVIRARSKRSIEMGHRAFMARQIGEVKSGHRTSVQILAPICVQDLVAEAACRRRVASVYLWSDLCGERWALLRELPSLENVHVYDSRRADTFLKHVRGMESLRCVSFEATPVSDAGIRWIATLPNLTELQFAGGDVTHAGVAHLQGHPNLEQLDFGAIRVTEAGMRWIATLPNLKELQVEGDGVTNAGIAHLRAHPNLERLQLMNTAVSDEGLTALKEIPKLRSLVLVWQPSGGQRLTDAGLKHLKELHDIETLEVSGGWASEAGVRDLQQALPQCAVRASHLP